jgi:holo-[acyl-carrier protein] synthase
MPILGHGIDIVETARVKRLVDEHGQRFLDRCFTPDEQAYCSRNPKRYHEHLAGRFAAKEAVLKVLGTGWRGGIQWTDIEVLKEPSGQPKIRLTRRVRTDRGRAGNRPLAPEHQPHRNPRHRQRNRAARRGVIARVKLGNRANSAVARPAARRGRISRTFSGREFHKCFVRSPS